MKRERLAHSVPGIMDFFEEGIPVLGGLAERTWHDRIQVLCEGSLASRMGGPVFEKEIEVLEAGIAGAQDATRQVFPGSPLLFALSESLIPFPTRFYRLAFSDSSPAPDQSIVGKLWNQQFERNPQEGFVSGFSKCWHYSWVAVMRCEIQAIQQQFSIFRLACGVSDGALDLDLATKLEFQDLATHGEAPDAWPELPVDEIDKMLLAALQSHPEFIKEREEVEARQGLYLKRELVKLDDYFKKYDEELESRKKRASSPEARLKFDQRLAASRVERDRRYEDQVKRHEIRIYPRLDSLLMVAERAWKCQLRLRHQRETSEVTGIFIPRLRQWRGAGER